jgi:eukaryotic-like serine/threonine-protein kinase
MSAVGRELSATIVDPHSDPGTSSRRVVAEYVLGERLAAGGGGTVHLGVKLGALGFRRLVAIKRLHPHLAHDVEFVSRFRDEIRLVSRFTHPNIVQTFDVVESAQELALIMEFADGVTLQELLVDARNAGVGVPPAVTVGIVCQALHGLHAAHEATDDLGQPLQIVHRDVSPQNVMVGKDGLVKVLDFGIAKAINDSHVTRTGQVSGKVAYMAPEQVLSRPVDRRTDVFAAGVVLWEALTGQRLFRGRGTPEIAALTNILELSVPPPSAVHADMSIELDQVVLRALERDPARRFGSARDFALALEGVLVVASASDIAGTTSQLCSARLERRAVALQRFWQAIGSGEAVSRVAREEMVTIPELAGAQFTERPPSLLDSTLSDFVTSARLTKGTDSELQNPELQAVLTDQAFQRVQPARGRYLGKAVALAAAVAALWVGSRGVLGWIGGPVRSSSAVPLAAKPDRPLPAALTGSVLAHIAPPTRPRENVEMSAAPQRSDRAAPPPPERAKTRRVAPSTSRTSRPARGTPQPKPQVQAATDACSPPTYTDAEGIHHFKRECL